MILEETLFGKKRSMLFRMDETRIIKIYDQEIEIKDIINDCNAARFLMKNGIPCVLSYELVRIQEAYGIIYHLPGVKTLGQILSEEPETMSYWAEVLVDFLCRAQRISVCEDLFAFADEVFLDWVQKDMGMSRSVPAKKLEQLLKKIPKEHSLVFGNLHCGNVLVWKGDLFLLDLNQIYIGHPIYGISKMFLTYELEQKGANTSTIEKFGLTIGQTERFWKIFKEAYGRKENWMHPLLPELFGNMVFLSGVISREEIPFREKEEIIQYLTEGIIQIEAILPQE